MPIYPIREEICDSPGWLNQLTDKYKRDHKANELRKAEDRQRDQLELVNAIATRLGKQEVATEVREPTQTLEAKSQADLIEELIETVSELASAIESLADRVDVIETQTQKRNGNGRSAITHSEPSQRDLEILTAQIENLGLTGEIRRSLPHPFIRGRFVG